MGISLGVEEVGGLAIASISSLAGPLAIFAAAIGIIIMLVEVFTTKTPKNPVDKFVDRDDVKKDSFYMHNEASIDYFQVINDKDKKPRDIGVAFAPKGSHQTAPLLLEQHLWIPFFLGLSAWKA